MESHKINEEAFIASLYDIIITKTNVNFEAFYESLTKALA